MIKNILQPWKWDFGQEFLLSKNFFFPLWRGLRYWIPAIYTPLTTHDQNQNLKIINQSLEISARCQVLVSVELSLLCCLLSGFSLRDCPQLCLRSWEEFPRSFSCQMRRLPEEAANAVTPAWKTPVPFPNCKTDHAFHLLHIWHLCIQQEKKRHIFPQGKEACPNSFSLGPLRVKRAFCEVKERKIWTFIVGVMVIKEFFHLRAVWAMQKTSSNIFLKNKIKLCHVR
jgi:hypothetical protein